MRLSVDKINENSPYWVIPLDVQTEELDFEGYVVYTGMIIRNDHPEYEEILATYKAFVQRAINIYKVQAK